VKVKPVVGREAEIPTAGQSAVLYWIARGVFCGMFWMTLELKEPKDEEKLVG